MYRGDGYEFVELRAYVPGDDVRRIDWAATARAGELQTRVVLEDVALTLAACSTIRRSMHVGRDAFACSTRRKKPRSAWFGAARSGDRLLRIGSDHRGTGACAGHDAVRICAARCERHGPRCAAEPRCSRSAIGTNSTDAR